MIRHSLRRGLGLLHSLKVSQLVCSRSTFTMATTQQSTEIDSSTSENALSPPALVAAAGNEVQPESTEQDINENSLSLSNEAENKSPSGSAKEEDKSLKRPNEDNESADTASEAKKPKVDDNDEDKDATVSSRKPYKKKKVALLLVYSGKGYTGMQMNPGMKTIEKDLIDSLVKAGVVTEDHAVKPSTQMSFQRAARTDKGVSAAGQVVSFKEAVKKINSFLVPQIRVLGYKRTTRGFSSKDTCTARTYMYMLPTFAFTPVEEFVTDNFKLSEETREKINDILAMYKGTHNFHNFTSGKKANDPSAQRYIMDMQIGEPFLRNNVEYAVITVKGQSFMLHQIRKMIGLMIAIIRGLASMKSMEYAWRPERADVPMAPGLGLVLEKLHYDAYNKRYGSDGMHEAIEWEEFTEEITKFKDEFIHKTIIETEKKERPMMSWLATLHNHHFEPKKTDGSIYQETGHGKAHTNVVVARQEDQEAEIQTQQTPEGASEGALAESVDEGGTSD